MQEVEREPSRPTEVLLTSVSRQWQRTAFTPKKPFPLVLTPWSDGQHQTVIQVRKY